MLAEEARGGLAALSPTRLQRVAGGVVHAVGLPTRFATRQVNRAVSTVYRTRGQPGEMAEQVARREGAEGVAGAVRELRTETGALPAEELSAEELPIRQYGEMPAGKAISAIRELTEPEEINTVIAFEERNKNRSGVLSAARARHAEIIKERTER
jgi:hypothetical protein